MISAGEVKCRAVQENLVIKGFDHDDWRTAQKLLRTEVPGIEHWLLITGDENTSFDLEHLCHIDTEYTLSDGRVIVNGQVLEYDSADGLVDHADEQQKILDLFKKYELDKIGHRLNELLEHSDYTEVWPARRVPNGGRVQAAAAPLAESALLQSMLLVHLKKYAEALDKLHEAIIHMHEEDAFIPIGDHLEPVWESDLVWWEQAEAIRRLSDALYIPEREALMQSVLEHFEYENDLASAIRFCPIFDVNEETMDCYWWLAYKLYISDELEKALEAQQKGLECLMGLDRPNWEGVAISLIWQGKCLYGMGRYREALDRLVEASNHWVKFDAPLDAPLHEKNLKYLTEKLIPKTLSKLDSEDDKRTYLKKLTDIFKNSNRREFIAAAKLLETPAK